MSKLIDKIRHEIDTEWLSEYLGENYAEELEYLGNNIQILEIAIDDLKNESYENIEHIGYVQNQDWDTLKTLVSEKEVNAIKDEFIEDNEMYRNGHDCNSSPCDCILNLYKAILYCKGKYIWSATTYSFDD